MKNTAWVLPAHSHIDWDHFEKALYDGFGVNAVTYQGDGRRRTARHVHAVNDICRLIKQTPLSAEHICAILQRYLSQEARAKRRYVTEECAAGMVKIVVPIISDDRVEGFVSACGRPFMSTDRVYTQYISETTDQDKAKIEKLLLTLNPIGHHTIKEMIAFITGYENKIV